MGFLWGLSCEARGVRGHKLLTKFFSANRWRTFGHSAPLIVTEKTLQIFVLLGASVGPPGAMCKIQSTDNA